MTGDVDWDSLESTLDVIDVNIPGDLEVIEYSPASEEANEELYESANDHMMSVIEEDEPGECIHITGEMRALADSFHRKVVQRLWERHESPFKMVFNLPQDLDATGSGIMSYNRRAWENVSWKDHISVFDLLKDGKVRLFDSPKVEPIHYTVYGDSFVMLQGEHDHLQHEKEVWLTDSRTLAERLVSDAEETIQSSTAIPPMVFNRFTASLSSDFALSILLKAQSGDLVESDEFEEPYLTNLQTIGFLSQNGNSIEITSSGEEFLEIMLN